MAATEFKIEAANPVRREFTARRNLTSGDKIEVRFNDEPALVVRVGGGFLFDSVVVIGGTVQEK